MDFEWNSLKTSMNDFFTHKIAAPLKRFWLLIAAFFRNIFTVNSPGDEDEQARETVSPVTDAAWKEEALEDFKLWLSQIDSENPPVQSVTPDTCDLYTMLSEFIALRQEIKMQNREQHRTVAALSSVKGVTDEYGQIFNVFRDRTNQLAQLEQNIRLNCEKKSVSHFFDVRDSLVRGHRASIEIAAKKGIFTRPPKGIEKICEGYEMAISRFDKALSMMDVEPVETLRMPFDAQTMKAVEIRTVPDTENGIVLETVSGGFLRGGEVLRYARVVVSRSQEEHSPQKYIAEETGSVS
ncbi:MAG: nucleotide exchange factor GrpE [Desulfamplus sp.]|nr:nucleotide exchange factor GrpE [Desulfamplus sp.]